MVAAQGNTEQNFTAMTYDSLGRKTTRIDPDMGYWTYQYDKAGILTSQTDAMGQTLNFGYDVLGRITQKIYPTTPSPARMTTAQLPLRLGCSPTSRIPREGKARRIAFSNWMSCKE